MFLSRWTAHEQWNITFILLKTWREERHQFVNLLPDRHAKFVIIQWITCILPKLANLLMHSQCALSEPISPSRKTRKLTGLSGNKFTNWCPSSRRVFKSIKVIFHCSWAVHLERNISFKESIHNCNCGFPWFNLSLCRFI
jgi:hypothetical protein